VWRGVKLKLGIRSEWCQSLNYELILDPTLPALYKFHHGQTMAN
jgi:hypothetical protein